MLRIAEEALTFDDVLLLPRRLVLLHHHARRLDHPLRQEAVPRDEVHLLLELLAVLGSSDPSSLQPHVIKLIQHCRSLSFERGNRVVGGMRSPKGESFDFATKVQTTPVVEGWMSEPKQSVANSSILRRFSDCSALNTCNSAWNTNNYSWS